MMKKKTLFYKKTSFFYAYFHLQLTFPYLSPKYPKELKWERQAISRKSKKCNYVNSGRPDSTRQTKVVIHPSNASYVYHIANTFFNLLTVLSETSVSLATFRMGYPARRSFNASLYSSFLVSTGLRYPSLRPRPDLPVAARHLSTYTFLPDCKR